MIGIALDLRRSASWLSTSKAGADAAVRDRCREVQRLTGDLFFGWRT
jgi:hypothetical protein